MDKFFKYLGYMALSLLVAWLSAVCKEDYVSSLCHSIVQLLITLLAIYSTVSSLLVSRLLSFKQEINHDADIVPVIKAMKRNVRIESLLILTTMLVIIVSNIVLEKEWLCECTVSVLRNAMVVFSLFYFVIVVYDSSMGLYDLLQFTKKK